MEPRVRTRVDLLDYLRGVAILVVFAVHWLGATFGYDRLPWRGAIRGFSVAPTFLALSPLSFGLYGVAIFFVISGFCIQLSYSRSTQAGWRSFFLRRFFRIYPPYLVALLFYAIVFPPTRLAFANLWDWAQLGSHLFLIHNSHIKLINGINGAFWSIAVEFQLYLLFPVLVALVAKLGWKRTLLIIGGLELSIRAFYGIYVTVTDSSLPTWFIYSPFIYWYGWSIGAYLADAFRHARPLPFSRTPLWLWLVLVPASYMVRPLATFTFLFVCLLTATFIAKFLDRTTDGARALPSFLAPLRDVGLWSYSLYLLHLPIVVAVVNLFKEPQVGSPAKYFLAFASFLVSLMIIVPLSFLFYRLIELPSMHLGKWIQKKCSGLLVPGSQERRETSPAIDTHTQSL